MKYFVLVSNESGIPTGEIVGVFRPDKVFSPIEVMSEHIKNGGTADNFSRLFLLVIGTDRSYEEMKYLNDYKSDKLTKKYFFKQPDKNTSEFSDLYLTGEVSRNTDKILEFIGEH